MFTTRRSRAALFVLTVTALVAASLIVGKFPGSYIAAPLTGVMLALYGWPWVNRGRRSDPHERRHPMNEKDIAVLAEKYGVEFESVDGQLDELLDSTIKDLDAKPDPVRAYTLANVTLSSAVFDLDEDRLINLLAAALVRLAGHADE